MSVISCISRETNSHVELPKTMQVRGIGGVEVCPVRVVEPSGGVSGDGEVYTGGGFEDNNI